MNLQGVLDLSYWILQGASGLKCLSRKNKANLNTYLRNKWIHMQAFGLYFERFSVREIGNMEIWLIFYAVHCVQYLNAKHVNQRYLLFRYTVKKLFEYSSEYLNLTFVFTIVWTRRFMWKSYKFLLIFRFQIQGGMVY